MPSTNASVAITGLLSMSLCSVVAYRTRDRIDLKMMLPALLGFAATSAAVIFFFADTPDALLRRMLAILLILLSIYFIFFSQKMTMHPGARGGFVAGCISGVTGGMFGMGGPPIVVYVLSACGDDSEKYLANMQFYFTMTSLYASVMRVSAGIIDGFVLRYWLIGLGAVFAGIYMGRRLFGNISAHNLRRLIYGFMAASGVVMLFQ